ncbi:nucleotidyltransferase domain-containing protein [Thioalkalivibrio sp. ALE23]|uniref:type VII toxin-antitoxin system MntA family adenylyltransferase antitoxin n=1 Tax=Thioalkalivibrio sp. ALE23 TaxID=1265495 RepID=UPI000377AA6A|nr:nucleotidyltransferase domain-containing protein [Thioalkalivibrio sp. ALE23]
MILEMSDSPLATLLRTRLAEQDAVMAAYLFGSHARGEACPDSDIDLAVLTPEPMSRSLLDPLARLEMDLSDTLGRRVDLVDLHSAPPDLVHRILRDGHLLLDRDPDRRAAFEVAARNAYFDFLPYLQEYRRGARSH